MVLPFLLLDIPDVFLILCGKELPAEKGVIYKRLVQLFVSEFLNSITPTLLIPYLLREGVLDNREAEKVKVEERSNGKWRAAWYLLFYLPQREADWLDIIMEALTASKHPELARQLENTCANEAEEKNDSLDVFEDAVDDVCLLQSDEEQAIKFDDCLDDGESLAREGSENAPGTSVNARVDGEATSSTEDEFNRSIDLAIEGHLLLSLKDDTLLGAAVDNNEHTTYETVNAEDDWKSISSVDEKSEREKSEKETVIALPDTMESNIVAKGKDGGKATIVSERNLDQNLMTELKENSPQMKSSLILAKNSSSDIEKLVDVRPKTNALKAVLKYKLKYSTNDLRHLQHSPLVQYPAQAFLRVPELFTDTSKTSDRAPEFKKHSIVTYPQSLFGRNSMPLRKSNGGANRSFPKLTENFEIESEQREIKDTLPNLPISLSKNDESETNSVGSLKSEDENNHNELDMLQDLVDALSKSFITHLNTQAERGSTRGQNEDVKSEEVNDLNKSTVEPSIATAPEFKKHSIVTYPQSLFGRNSMPLRKSNGGANRSFPKLTENFEIESEQREIKDTLPNLPISLSKNDESETNSVGSLKSEDENNHNELDMLQDLVDALSKSFITHLNTQAERGSTRGQNEDVKSEEVNDLNKSTVEPSIATDYDNLNTDLEEVIPLRGYQEELAEKGCEGENVIVLAPTNSGKTWVACRIIQEHFRRSQGQQIAKCAFVVENTALAQQQGECCAELLKHLRTKVVSGETQRDKKEYLKDFVDRRDILVVTAKVFHNTLIQKDIDSIQTFSLIVFDECHHTQADHPYNEIMNLYHELKSSRNCESSALPQVIGLTASLGVGGAVTLEKAEEHMKALMANLDARYLCRVKSRDNVRELEQYQNTPDEEIVIVPRRVKDSFRKSVTDVMKAIEGLISQTRASLHPVDVQVIDKIIQTIPAQKGSEPYIQWLSNLEKGLAELRSEDVRRILNSCRLHLLDYNQAIILYNDARVEDALDYLEEEMEEKRNPANTEIEVIMFEIYDRLKTMTFEGCNINPKLLEIQKILLDEIGRDENGRGIIFVRTRLLAMYLIKWMKSTDALSDLNPTTFVGQNAPSDLGGMTKHEQKNALVYFKDGLHKLIVATSVAEEGLDITKCKLVIRYEHVTNEIVRTQSRGRARAPNSKYYVVTGQGSPIADKEEKNAKQEELMNKAVIALEDYIARNKDQFEMKLNTLQFSAKHKRDMKQKRRSDRLVHGEFELQCFHCSHFICMSSDVKKIQSVHHVCIADDIRERVNSLRSPIPLFEESDMKMDGETSCRNCERPLGGVCEYKGVEFPLLKIAYFRVVDRNGKGSHHKKWKGVSFFIEEISNEDLLNFARANNSDSD